MKPHPYSERWRDRVRDGAISSAQVLVPMLVDRFAPATVVDLGAGEGHFVDAFRAAGVAATGIDGPWTDAAITADLADGFPDVEPADLALCLEVAEHLPDARADELVAWLVACAPTVVFSAAIPGQGGTGHVNEQPPGYWAEKFAQHGHRRGSGALRWEIWDDEKVEPWYRQNVLVFGAHDLPADGCPHVVHPDIWKLYRK